MQMFVLALMLGIFIHDGEPALTAWPSLHGPVLWAVALLPQAALGALYALACRLTLRRLGRSGGPRALRSLEKITSVFRYTALVLYFLGLWLGVLDALRELMPRTILISEVLVMLPTLTLVAWSWWVYYPIERRLREAALIGRADRGLPVFPIWTRGQYIVAQFRHQVLLVLAPLLALVGWLQIVELYVPDNSAWIGPDARALLLLGGVGAIFLFAPIMIRHIWDTAPLPEGELRQRLIQLCERHHVGVRQLLLWRTFGGMINAAVMGLVSPLRYILLTDALLEMVPLRQVEAVMAHEIAHVRKHHIFWLAAAMLASGGVLMTGCNAGVSAAAHTLAASSFSTAAHLGQNILNHDTAARTVSSAVALAAWAFVFGWVSRRFERQADTFAVQHLAAEQSPDTPARVDQQSIDAMASALQHIADLNCIPAHRASWRHGSIAWRQQHLAALLGQRIDQLPIDRVVFRIKLATLALIAVLVAAHQVDWLMM